MDDTTIRRRRRRGKKKKWTKKRIRRYAKVYALRALVVLVLLAALFLIFTGVKACVRALTGHSKEPKAQVEDVIDESQGDVLGEDSVEMSEPGGEEGEAENPEAVTESDPTAEPAATGAEEATAETETTATGAATGTPQGVRTFTLTATGDMTFGRTTKQGYRYSFDEVYDKNGANYFFANLRDTFQADNLTLGNLEVALTESDKKASKKTAVYLKGRPEYTQILSGSSVEMVSLGNNHSGDFGEQGMSDTQAALDLAGVKWALDTTVGYYTTPDGIKVGLVSKEVIPVTAENTAEMVNGIKEARANGANIVIATPHWGSEKDYSANDPQIELAHKLIDAGADVVIGNHPHVLQGAEYYNGKMICYSLGNFSFGGNLKPYDWDAIVYQQTFTLHDGVPQKDLNAKVIPILTSTNTKKNNYQPQIVDGSAKTKILDKFNKYSKDLGNLQADENGVISSPGDVNS